MTTQLDEDLIPGAEEPTSVRDALSASFDDWDAANPEADAPAAPAADAPAKTAPATAPARAPDGKFAKTPETPQGDPQITQPSALDPQTGAPSQAPTGPPASWSATAKAAFPSLPPAIQQEVLKREADMDRGRAQWQQGADRLNRLDAILTPRREQFTLAGLDEVRAVETLFAAQDFLQRDPAGALLYLGRQSGVDWNALFGRLQGQPAQPQQNQQQAAQLPPQFVQVAQQVQHLTQQAEQQRLAAPRNAVADFAANPENVYFENVRERMRTLIANGDASDLSDAYQQACWSHPEIRPLMQAASAKAQADAAAAQARARTVNARHASGSVIGSPTPGASPGARAAAPATVRDALAQAWDDFS